MLGFAQGVWNWNLPTPLPSAGVVPSELPPFDGPDLVICVGNGSKARLQNVPLEIRELIEYSVSLLMLRILASSVDETP